MEYARAPLDLDWVEILGHTTSPEQDVYFAPPAAASASAPPAAAAEEIARLSDGDLQREIARLGGRRPEFARMLCDRGASRRRRLALFEAESRRRQAAKRRKFGETFTCAAHATQKDHFTFDIEDEIDRDDVAHKFHPNSAFVPSRNKNYGQLGVISRRSQRIAGQMRPISADKMYSSKLSCRTSAGHRQRVHAIHPKETDHENCLQGQHTISSNSTKRRKALQHKDPSSIEFQRVRDVVLLDDEDAQPVEPVDCEMPDSWNEPKIYYPSRDDSEAVELTYSDLKCLNPAVYLSSPVINFYIQFLKRSRFSKQEWQDNYYIFNTYFYSKLNEALLGKGEFSKLRRWWKGVDIFQKAYIILPIHGRMHWSLIIICMPAKGSKSGPTILHLDSLGLHSSVEIFDTIGRFLEAEWDHLRQSYLPDIPFSETIWNDLPSNIYKEKVKVPQQKNEYDCGIFMLYYIERFIREAPQRFTGDELDKFGRGWFKSEEASVLRERIKALLLDEFESARLEDPLSDAAMPGSSDSDEEMIEGGVLESAAFSDSSRNAQGIIGGGGNGKSDEEIAEVGVSEATTTSCSPRRDEEITNWRLSTTATLSDSSENEEIVEALFDSSKDEQEIVMVPSDRSRNPGGVIYGVSEVTMLSDSSNSDDEEVEIIEVRDQATCQQNLCI